jgi:hypothetical protein
MKNMDALPNIDDRGIEALLSGLGHNTDALLAEALTRLRRHYTETPPKAGPALAALLSPDFPARVRRLDNLRSALPRKVAAAAAIIAATFGGLAVANALPASFQNAVAHLGIGHSNQTPHSAAPRVSPTTPTTTGDATTTTNGTPPANHGRFVRGVAHDRTGCGHGSAVSEMASDGRTHNPGEQTQTDRRRCARPTKPVKARQQQLSNTQTGGRGDQHKPQHAPTSDNPPHRQHGTDASPTTRRTALAASP